MSVCLLYAKFMPQKMDNENLDEEYKTIFIG